MTSTSDEKWYITEQTFPELLHRNVTQFGHRTAQRWKSHGSGELSCLTYGELGDVIREISCGLMALGVAGGDRVGIMGTTSPQWMQADYAILCAGGITTCVYPSLTAGELAYLINDSGSTVLFVQDASFLETVRAARSQMPDLSQVILLSGDEAPDKTGALTLEGLKKRGRAYHESSPTNWEARWRSVALGDPMTIVYTSGTTGNPKGAVHTHASVNAACRRDLNAIPVLTDQDLLLSFLPLSHTYERECGHGIAMHAALPIAYSSPKNLVADLSVFRPTLFMSVPRIYERIYMAMKEKASASSLKRRLFFAAMETGRRVVDARADAKGFVDMSEGADLLSGAGPLLSFKYRLFDRLIFSKVRKRLGGRFRFAFSAAGSLSADLCKTFMAMGVRIFEGYGSTETCNTVNLNTPGAILPGSVGAPCAGVTGRIADDGEWQVKGDNLFVGYWNNEEATRAAFTEDGFYRTGDIVEKVAGEHIRIVDRKNGLLVLDTGKNVPSAKVESLFALSPYIDSVMAVGSGEKFITALVIPDFDALLSVLAAEDPEAEQYALSYADGLCTEVVREMLERPSIMDLIQGEIDAANHHLEPHEQIKKFHVSNRRLTEDAGELTPTFKVKRKVVMAHYARDMEALYRRVRTART
ncbi:AMP-dependent synthetase/ligase [Desulfoluna spongiiphila]|uniref:Long-chain acyl-CoA synthetase n=1 Tax=Desulfoluna spongiiphila TaxID=419481 RepID=A0A1G5HN55_9BACT|nr:long-chain fatty acid--CoA ligase [Desulfoluna spongiiphila]SCY65193.1 long-chain acyl-CoA synthetase [Desulfoluna spongiiphila]